METKILGYGLSAEYPGSFPAGAESIGWSQVPGQPWGGDMGMFCDWDRSPGCQS